MLFSMKTYRKPYMVYHTLNNSEVKLKGKVVSGLGVGRKYVELYRHMFRKYLGINPFPGTLNVDVGCDVSAILAKMRHKLIPPPFPGYGEVIAYKGYIKDLEVYVIKPCITSHGWNILEIISEKNLRKQLKLRDGDEIEITIVRL